MATTKVKPIYTVPDGVIDYTKKNKGAGPVAPVLEVKDVAASIAYAMNDKTGEVTFHTMTSRHNCLEGKEAEYFLHDMAAGKGKHYSGTRAKNGVEPVCYHLFQCFNGHEVEPRTANEIGLKLAREVLGNFSCVISTHTNTDNIHNHIVFCAWDKDGYKWNDCLKTKRLIRSVSDRLCEQYGLSVLEHTRGMRLKKYTDKKGNKRYVEVTPRKMALWKDYREGKTPIASANDYRNSEVFKIQAANIQSNRESIKEDIDSLLPHVSSYEELLTRMRDMGYDIKDRKANGDWRVHITFTAPGQNKGTRECRLGDGMFYTRESLEAFLSSRDKPQRITKDEHMHLRSEPEKMLIRDTEKKRTELKEIAGNPTDKERYIESLRKQIKDNMSTLSFMEDRGLYSYAQINELYKSAYDSYCKTSAELIRLDKELSRLEQAAVLPVNENGLNIPEDRDKLNQELNKVSDRIEELRLAITHGKNELQKYELCVRTLDRIDRKHGLRDDRAMKEHYKIKAIGRSREKKQGEVMKPKDNER